MITDSARCTAVGAAAYAEALIMAEAGTDSAAESELPREPLSMITGSARCTAVGAAGCAEALIMEVAGAGSSAVVSDSVRTATVGTRLVCER